MRDIFEGFLVLRLIGFLVLLIVVALVVGIWSLARGSELAGVGILASVVVFGAAIRWLMARRANGRPR